MAFNPTRAFTHNEDCDLHYWYQGTGPLVTFIPGGNGYGAQFNNIIAALSPNFTCATFDRRQMSASSVTTKNKPLSPPQQARDVAAVIRAVGFTKSIIFGSSLGGIIAFVFALDFPDMVEHVMAHEAPTTQLLPNAGEMYDWFLHLTEKRDTEGYEAAQKEFATSLVGYDDDGVPSTGPPLVENTKNFWTNEAFTASVYTPNLWRLRENGMSVGLMTAVRSRDAFYVRTVHEQEKILGCPRLEVPGHHQGFQVETEAFLPFFYRMLEVLEEKKKGAP